MSYFVTFLAVVAAVSVVSGRSAFNSNDNTKANTKNPGSIHVGAFNIQTFGRAKMSDPVVAAQIVEIVLQYDILLIQEIRDITMESVIQLFTMLNARESMNYVISARLGRTSYKEQYAFFYKTDIIEILGHHQFDDDAYGDVFEREPYSVLMNVRATGLNMTLVALHAKPDDAVIEITALRDVYYDVLDALVSPNVVILGDLNAACSYAKVEELEETYVFSDSKFISLIPHDANTTVSNTNCAYDRIIVSGGDIPWRVIYSGVHLFDAEDELDLDQSEALKVSDHYPVEMWLTL